MEIYQGTERRKNENLQIVLDSIRELFDQKMDNLKERLDRFEVDTKRDIENIGARVENMINVYEMRARTSGDELAHEVEKLKRRIFDLEQAPLKKAAEVQKGFWKNGQEIFIKGFWTIGLGFLAFLVLKYLEVFK